MRPDLAKALAGAYLAAPWDQAGLIAAGRQVAGLEPRQRPRWVQRVAIWTLDRYPRAPLDRPRELAAVLEGSVAGSRKHPVRPVFWTAVPTRMLSNPHHLPELHSLAEVQRLLDLTPGELAWFADPRHLGRSETREPLLHYRVSTRPSASGGVRVLEAPKPRLREIQRRLLTNVLDRLPPHDAAHGFRRGHSVATYAAPHAGRAVVLHLDLEGFFASIPVGRVHAVFRRAGYPEPVAHCLAGLTTTELPVVRWRAVPLPADPALQEAHWRLGRRLAGPHLPQGAPTSPALANLVAARLDVRLTALAATWGGRYTRYADDLAFSGGRGWGTGTSRLIDAVAAVAAAEGFRLNERKTGVLPRGGRQTLAGLVVNDAPKVSRAETDRLRAILHNCLRDGAASQNRQGIAHFREHLVGRVGWVAQHDAARGARMQAQLAAIDWES